jgi:trehalose 6-phosphate phosphatase
MTGSTAQHAMIDPGGAAVGLPRSVSDLAVFLDVDGTLIDIAETPDAIVVPPRLPGDLERVRDAASGALALVSGRSIDFIDRMFAPAKLTAIGLHGGEVREPDGRLVVMPTPQILAELRPSLTALANRFPGALLEDKGHSIAVHYRRAPVAEREIEEAVEAMAASAGGDIVVQKGKKVIELRPGGSSKGGAVDAMMRISPFAGRQPFAIGDDVTDEAMFSTVNALGGTTIRVGPPDRSTAARFRIDDPAAVRDWLASLT